MDIPGRRGFTVYGSGDFYSRTNRPPRVRVLVSEDLAMWTAWERGVPNGLFVDRLMRNEAMSRGMGKLKA